MNTGRRAMQCVWAFLDCNRKESRFDLIEPRSGLQFSRGGMSRNGRDSATYKPLPILSIRRGVRSAKSVALLSVGRTRESRTRGAWQESILSAVAPHHLPRDTRPDNFLAKSILP
ncbi:hypothetical protein Nepgr_013187 [Nepenthes gracilis]|uniref:Uncharacterized protein n=1 Tax=Nepenthes gracilis TaxID=150966 RepID=A0AAD3SIH1_NEPGR|nr:hypothetical protein Nepgr_013187 [Nepenthes gracilis]